MTTDDLNPVYGVYFDPDPRMEFEDTNDNYSSDYEPVGTSRTTDNNPYYEQIESILYTFSSDYKCRIETRSVTDNNLCMIRENSGVA